MERKSGRRWGARKWSEEAHEEDYRGTKSLFMQTEGRQERQDGRTSTRLNCDKLAPTAATTRPTSTSKTTDTIGRPHSAHRSADGGGDCTKEAQNRGNLFDVHTRRRATSGRHSKWQRARVRLLTASLWTLVALAVASSRAHALQIHVRALDAGQSAGRQADSAPVFFIVAPANSTGWRRHSKRGASSADSDESHEDGRRGGRAPAGAHQQRRSAKLLEVEALNYLQRYGYMNSTQVGAGSAGGNLISEDSFQEAVMQFQRFAGIPETGAVDSLTVRYMQMPRCGNKDLGGKGENGKRRRRRRRKRRRRKRYALQGSKWRRQELTYRISQYPTRFLHKKHEVDGQIERAFRIWSQVAPIDFVVKREGRVHIDIRFASGEHGDGDPFDGPGNTLAHAYFPQYGGDAHFDDQEYWTVDSYAGTNIFQVAAHELGHSLGLGHSSVREALMAPFYQKYKPNFKLHADDVLGIQALYGERDADADSSGGGGGGSSSTSTPSTTTTSSTEASVPRRRTDEPDEGSSFFGGGGGGGGGGAKAVDLCEDPKIDTITRTEDGNTYVFRGHHYWQIKNEGLAPGFPARISRDWDGLPGNLDAALTWSDGKTFFFKGDKYWRFFNKRREPGYPKQISVGFAGIPNNLDAAFVWSGNGKTYFFKRDKYWRFDSKQEPPVSGQYPKPIKNWSGLPASGLDGAFKWDNGMTYFFKDDLYYRFDDREFEVDSSARPQFPRATAEWWFGCTNSNLPIRRPPARESDELHQPAATDTPGAASTLMLFHRKPTLSYESGGGGGGGGGGGAKPSSGSSLSRSILSSLSALFPSSLTSSSSSSSSSESPDSQDPNSNTNLADEWAFHRGVGEEVRRQQHQRRAGARSHRQPPAADEARRWSFPLVGPGEQSLSELRLEPGGAVAPDELGGPAAATAAATREAEELRSASSAASRARAKEVAPPANATHSERPALT